jgi:hypothetical protein
VISLADDGSAEDDLDFKVETPDEHTVNYVFPVTIVVVGALTDDDRNGIVKDVWSGFNDAMRNA